MGPCLNPENRKKGDWNRRLTLCFNNIFKLISQADNNITCWEEYKTQIPRFFKKRGYIKDHIKILSELLPALKKG